MNKLGSGRGKVDCPVASKIRDVRFEPSHRQVFFEHLFAVCRKDKNKEKVAEIGSTCQLDLC